MREIRPLSIAFCLFVIVMLFGNRSSILLGEETASSSKRLYCEIYEPTEHPEYQRHYVAAPGWETFGHKTQFMTCRSFPQENGKIVRIDETLDQYENFNLGKVTWPDCSTMFTTNLEELAQRLKERGYFMVDVWGYVPGVGYTGGGGYCEQFKVAPEQLAILSDILGKQWLGMDNGEQDGRYIGGYAPNVYPIANNHFEQYKSFLRHFERLCDDQGNVMATLVSLNFGHHFLKEGIYTLIGAEAAQALPNSQVYYAYNRGAGKQYGVLWFGNASVFNRWGWKCYPHENPAQLQGPKYGTSLALLKRLLYSHILYNSAAVGFESNWLSGDELTPIGKIQSEAANWLDRHGSPGVMAVPVALLTDFYSGWSFPRHLYTDATYRVWGNIPYGPGDFLNNNVLEILYPQYQDSSYYHDETGFISPTPYGDIADCLMTDAENWLLSRYPMMIVSGSLRGEAQIEDKLTNYVVDGGKLLMTAGNIAVMPEPFLGVTAKEGEVKFPAGSTICGEWKVESEEWKEDAKFPASSTITVTEERPFTLLKLQLPENAEILATADSVPVIIRIKSGKGELILLASPFGIADESATGGSIANLIDVALPNPFPLLRHVEVAIRHALDSQTLFDVGDQIASIVCRKDKGVYTLGVFNNQLKELPFSIRSRIGEIDSVVELPLDSSERTAVGFLPLGFEESKLGKNSDTTIAGADVRIFEIRLKEEQLIEMPKEAMPKRAVGRYLPLRSNNPIKEEIVARSTFFEHYDGVHVDWRSLASLSMQAVAKDAPWIKRQKLRLVVDFTSGINLFPDLRLIRNEQSEYEQSLQTFYDIFDKMELLGAADAIITTHRSPEIAYEPTDREMIETIGLLCREAKKRGITLSIRTTPNGRVTWLGAALAIIDQVNEENLKIAAHRVVIESEQNSATLDRAREKVSFILMASTLKDMTGSVWSFHGPLTSEVEKINFPLYRSFPNASILFDAVYQNQDEEYRDVKLFE